MKADVNQTCKSFLERNQLHRYEFKFLNPDISCDQLIKGTSICIKPSKTLNLTEIGNMSIFTQFQLGLNQYLPEFRNAR